jgi:hypothetical protein
MEIWARFQAGKRGREVQDRHFLREDVPGGGEDRGSFSASGGYGSGSSLRRSGIMRRERRKSRRFCAGFGIRCSAFHPNDGTARRPSLQGSAPRGTGDGCLRPVREPAGSRLKSQRRERGVPGGGAAWFRHNVPRWRCSFRPSRRC